MLVVLVGGAVLGEVSSGGTFDAAERELHINVLEAKAVLFGLKSLCPAPFVLQ